MSDPSPDQAIERAQQIIAAHERLVAGKPRGCANFCFHDPCDAIILARALQAEKDAHAKTKEEVAEMRKVAWGHKRDHEGAKQDIQHWRERAEAAEAKYDQLLRRMNEKP